ncbi:hypothetical protein OFC46_27810, partial [Escherichia coli]|nr:hypothetical protein [Escherichia coli]
RARTKEHRNRDGIQRRAERTIVAYPVLGSGVGGDGGEKGGGGHEGEEMQEMEMGDMGGRGVGVGVDDDQFA